jgi:hypothetical protein
MNEHPIKRTFYNNNQAVAQGATKETALFVAPFDATIEKASLTLPMPPSRAQNTNSRTLSVINKGAAGAGTTEIASKAFVSTVNANAFDETAITLSGTAANLNVVAGDVIAFKSAHVGSGLADGGGLVKVVLAKR